MSLLFWVCACSTGGFLIYWAFFYPDEEIRRATKFFIFGVLFLLALCYMANELLGKYYSVH